MSEFNLHQWRNKYLFENELSKGQQKIASAAPPEDEITRADFRAMQDKKKTGIKEVKLDYDFNEDELEKIVQTLKRHYSTLVNPIKAIEAALGKNVAAWDDLPIDEGQDHEVSMAISSLKSIVSSATQLMNMLGQEEKDIPAWIQDHITNAENYINQASKNYHEYGEEEHGIEEGEDNELDPEIINTIIDKLQRYKDGQIDMDRTKILNFYNSLADLKYQDKFKDLASNLDVDVVPIPAPKRPKRF
jgi:hypothetical protein